MPKKVILASSSPRRKDILTQAGIAHNVIVSGVDETATGSPAEMVEEIAMRKAQAVLELIEYDEDTIVIAADTIVYANNQVMGKPTTTEEAFDMLRQLQDNDHEVYTGVAMLTGKKATVFFDMTEVTFRQLSDDEIMDYIATGEPFDKAGGYGIQGRGATLVERINGDFYTVVGLPIAKVVYKLRQLD